MARLWIGLSLLLFLTFAGCGGGDKPAPQPAVSTAPPAVPDEVNGATITGKVLFQGEKPVVHTLDMSAVPTCENAHKTPVKSEEVVLNANGTLKNAFVWVKSGLPAGETWQVPSTPVVLSQNGCVYEPHVLGIMTTQNLDIKNPDPTNHNIHPTPANNPDYNQSQMTGSPDILHSFANQEVMVPIKCNIHNWMRAYVGVLSHPFFAVTGDDGTYTIKGLPPGTYTIEVWQEKYLTQDQQITVGPKDSKSLDFTYKG